MTARRIRYAASLTALAALMAAACSQQEPRSEAGRDRSEAAADISPRSSAPSGVAGPADFTSAGPGQVQASPARFNGPQRALPPGAVELTLSTIQDAGGPRSPAMIAGRLLAPAGWATQSTVTWTSDPNSCAQATTVRWAANSPDGVSSIEAFPSQTWSSVPNDRMTCPIADITSIEAYLRTLVQGRYPGARIISTDPREDVRRAMSPSVDRALPQMNDPRIGKQTRFETGEIRYEQTVNGVVIEGIIISAGYFGSTRPYQAYYNGPWVSPTTGMTTGSWSARAPKGQLNLHVLDAVRRSIRMDDRWTLAGMQVQTARGSARLEDMRDQADALNRRIAATRAAEARGGNAWADYGSGEGATAGGTSDASQRERLEVLKGVETYDDPIYGGTVQLDNTYDHAWRIENRDSYILTNDPNFNPGQYDIQARQLQVTR